MFDNGSFLRRRRRFKKKELAPNSTTKLTDALKTLDKFAFSRQEMNTIQQTTLQPTSLGTPDSRSTLQQQQQDGRQICTLDNQYYSAQTFNGQATTVTIGSYCARADKCPLSIGNGGSA